MTEVITIRRDDFEALMGVAASGQWRPGTHPQIAEAWQRLSELKDAPGEDGPTAELEPALPDGEFVRVELPGYRHHTGWMTEGTRAGAGCLIVRDWDGHVLAEVFPGPLCQVVHLPTPLKRPEPQAALPAGEGFGDDDDGCGCAPGFICADCRDAGMF